VTSLSSEALLGREQELGGIDGLLDAIAEHGGSMLIRGEAGLGKSALLDEAGARATGRGIAVLRTAGAPSETQLAFSGLRRGGRRPQAGLSAAPIDGQYLGQLRSS
jgi:predicted ATP-dependent serine protease